MHCCRLYNVASVKNDKSMHVGCVGSTDETKLTLALSVKHRISWCGVCSVCRNEQSSLVVEYQAPDLYALPTRSILGCVGINKCSMGCPSRQALDTLWFTLAERIIALE